MPGDLLTTGIATAAVLLVAFVVIFQTNVSGHDVQRELRNLYTTTMTNATVTRDASAAPESTRDFFNECANGRDESTEVSGGYGSYPYIYVVEIDDETYYAFETDLPEDREPWHIGFRPVRRDMVLDAETLEEVEGDTAEKVRSLVDLLGEQ